MNKYKGLLIPKLNIASIQQLSSAIRKTDASEYNSICHNLTALRFDCIDKMDCVSCILYRENIDTAVEYFLSKGYINKADALEHMLSLSK